MATKGKYKLKNLFLINKTYSGIYNKLENKHLETEAVFGEEFLISKTTKNYSFGTLSSDNYQGWIKNEDLSSFTKTTHKVILPNIIVYDSPDIKSSNILNLSLGSKVQVIKKIGKWLEINLLKDKKINIGYVNKNSLIKLNKKFNDWVELAESLLNIPYKWGGRSFLGLDCSALVQLTISFKKDIFFPRNSLDQFNYCMKYGKTTDIPRRGTLVFWEGHIGIMIDDKNLIHANGFHAQVYSEPLKQAIKRLKKECGNIKCFFNLIF